MAGVVNPGSDALVAVPKAATAAAVTAAAVAEGIQQVLPALQTVSQVAQVTSSLPDIIRLGAGLLVLICIGASLYTWWRLRRARRVVQS